MYILGNDWTTEIAVDDDEYYYTDEYVLTCIAGHITYSFRFIRKTQKHFVASYNKLHNTGFPKKRLKGFLLRKDENV